MFQSPGRAYPPCPSCFLGRALSCCVFLQGLACATHSASFICILLGCRFLSPGPQRHSRFSWAKGEWVFASLLCPPNTHDSCLWYQVGRALHTPVFCVSLAFSFFIVNALKTSYKVKVCQDRKQKGKCCCNWEHKGPPQKGAPPQHHCLNHGLPGAGWGSLLVPPSLLLSLPPSPGTRGSSYIHLFSLEASVTSGVRTPPTQDSSPLSFSISSHEAQPEERVVLKKAGLGSICLVFGVAAG